jgi:hypothetical protein
LVCITVFDGSERIPISCPGRRRRKPSLGYAVRQSRASDGIEPAEVARPRLPPTRVGTRAVVIRRVGGRETESAAEVAELQPPTRWGVRGVDGPVRGDVTGTIEPLDNGTRSRVTLALELKGTASESCWFRSSFNDRRRKRLPRNAQNLKEALESDGSQTR